MDRPPIEARGAAVVLRVRVQPKASRNRVLDVRDAYYRVSLTAPPVDGAANAALVAYLAKAIGVPRKQIELTGGKHARTKSLLITGSDTETVRRMLEAAMAI